MSRSRIETNPHPVSASRRHIVTQTPRQPLHRAEEVMQQEKVTVRTVARRMKVSADQVNSELDPRRDLRLSELYRWQAALKVPIAELLSHPGTGLSESIQLRAKLLKMMKTVRSIQEKSEDEAIDRLAARLASQLMDLMPELKEVAPWPIVGKRRSLDELGAITERVMPDSMFGTNPHGTSPSSSMNE